MNNAVILIAGIGAVYLLMKAQQAESDKARLADALRATRQPSVVVQGPGGRVEAVVEAGKTIYSAAEDFWTWAWS